MKKILSKNEQATRILAKNIITELKGNTICLQGELGSGKTVFVKGVAEQLGIKDIVNSPTFVIMKIYQIPKVGKWQRLIHADLYRLDRVSVEELRDLGLQEYIEDPDSLVIIEWSERMSKQPAGCQVLEFTVIDEDTRQITY